MANPSTLEGWERLATTRHESDPEWVVARSTEDGTGGFIDGEKVIGRFDDMPDMLAFMRMSYAMLNGRAVYAYWWNTARWVLMMGAASLELDSREDDEAIAGIKRTMRKMGPGGDGFPGRYSIRSAIDLKEGERL